MFNISMMGYNLSFVIFCVFFFLYSAAVLALLLGCCCVGLCWWQGEMRKTTNSHYVVMFAMKLMRYNYQMITLTDAHISCVYVHVCLCVSMWVCVCLFDAHACLILTTNWLHFPKTQHLLSFIYWERSRYK